MNWSSLIALLLFSAKVIIAVALSKQEELVNVVQSSNRRDSKHKIVEDLLKDPAVDPSANDNELFLLAVPKQGISHYSLRSVAYSSTK